MPEGSSSGYNPNEDKKRLSLKQVVQQKAVAVTNKLLGGYNVPEGVPSSGSTAEDSLKYTLQKDKYILDLYQKWGNFVAIGVAGGNHSVFIRDASVYRDILDGKRTNVSRRGFIHELIRDSIGRGGLPATPETLDKENGEETYHKGERKAAAPHATPEGKPEHEQLVKGIITEQMERVGSRLDEAYAKAIAEHDVAEVDISTALVDFTFHAVVESMFGIGDVGAEIDKMNADPAFMEGKARIGGFDDLKMAIRTSNERISTIINLGGEEFYKKSPGYKDLEARFNHAVALLDTYAAWMDDHAPVKHKDGQATYMESLKRRHPDVPGDPEKTAENRQLRYDQLKGMTIAGFETTAITLLYSLYKMEEYPDLHDRLDAAIEDHNDIELENIFYEITRLFPGIPRLSRVLEEPLEIDLLDEDEELTNEGKDTMVTNDQGEITKVREYKQEGEIKTKKIVLPKGSVLTYLVREGNRDPMQWENPDAFDPDRWYNFRNERDALSKPEAYMSFGAKQTSCIGENFAKYEFMVFMKWLKDAKRKYDIVPSDGDAPEINEDWIIAEFKAPKVKAMLLPRPGATTLEQTLPDVGYAPDILEIPQSRLELSTKDDADEELITFD